MQKILVRYPDHIDLHDNVSETYRNAIRHMGAERVRDCGLDMEERYGPLGKNRVEVHHLMPISMTEGRHLVNAATDLVILCPNCNAMIHRLPTEAMTVDELKKHIH